jgi:hypothetical protein
MTDGEPIIGELFFEKIDPEGNKMKSLLSTLVLCAFMTPAVAMSDANEECKMIGDIAESIMKARQAGVPISHAYEITAGNELATELARQAYEKTRWGTDELQLREVQDFKVFSVLACYTARGLG